MHRTAIGVFLSIGLACGVVGCSGSDYSGPELYPVTATVTRDGQPFKEVNVSLVPVDGNDGKSAPAFGTATPEGTIGFMTGNNEGVAAGDYKVTLQWTPPAEAYSNPRGGPPKPPFPAEWTDPTKTPTTVTIPEGGADDLKIEF